MKSTITIPGRPASQKNSKEIGTRGRGGKPFIRSNDRVLDWKRDAVLIVRAAWRKSGHAIPPGVEVECRVTAYLAKGQTMDADAIASAPMDALEAAGVVTNDYWLMPVTILRKRDHADPRIEIELWW